MTSPSEQAKAAYSYGHQQIWDALRGMHAAFQVDTGGDLDMQVPTWAELTETQRAAFIVLGVPGVATLSGVFHAIASGASS